MSRLFGLLPHMSFSLFPLWTESPPQYLCCKTVDPPERAALQRIHNRLFKKKNVKQPEATNTLADQLLLYKI